MRPGRRRLAAALGAVRTELGDEGLDGLLATLRVHFQLFPSAPSWNQACG